MGVDEATVCNGRVEDSKCDKNIRSTPSNTNTADLIKEWSFLFQVTRRLFLTERTRNEPGGNHLRMSDAFERANLASPRHRKRCDEPHRSKPGELVLKLIHPTPANDNHYQPIRDGQVSVCC